MNRIGHNLCIDLYQWLAWSCSILIRPGTRVKQGFTCAQFNPLRQRRRYLPQHPRNLLCCLTYRISNHEKDECFFINFFFFVCFAEGFVVKNPFLIS